MSSETNVKSFCDNFTTQYNLQGYCKGLEGAIGAFFSSKDGEFDVSKKVTNLFNGVGSFFDDNQTVKSVLTNEYVAPVLGFLSKNLYTLDLASPLGLAAFPINVTAGRILGGIAVSVMTYKFLCPSKKESYNPMKGRF